MSTEEISTIDEPAAAATADVSNKVLHWGIVYVALSFGTLILDKIFQWILLTIIQSPNLYSSVSPQTVFDVLYIGQIALNVFFAMLWVYLTYRRFSYSKVWKTCVLLEIVSMPILCNTIDADKLTELVRDALMRTASASPGLIVVSVLLSMITLVYFIWAVRKAKDDPLNHPVIKSVTEEMRIQQRMHWLLAAVITLVAGYVLARVFIHVVPRLTNIDSGQLWENMVTSMYYIVVIVVLAALCLWIILTHERYAGSLNWQAGTLLFFVAAQLTVYYACSTFAKHIPENLLSDIGMSERRAMYLGIYPFTFSPGHLLAGLLLGMLPLWYFWRMVQKAGGCPLLRDQHKPAGNMPQADDENR